MSFFCVSISLLSLFLPFIYLFLFFLTLLCLCDEWDINERCVKYFILKDFISRELWIDLFFSLSICSLCSPLSVFLLSIKQSLHHYMNIHLSLPQPVAKQCKQRMWQSWREALPRSPAACRTMMAQLWSSRIPAGRLSSSTAREVCSSKSVYANACAILDIWSNNVIQALALAPNLHVIIIFHIIFSFWQKITSGNFG